MASVLSWFRQKPNYILGDYIDRGASGRVVKAWRENSGNKKYYACKIFKKSHINYSALLNEVALINQAKNKHVVSVEGPWETKKEYQILLDPLANGNLADYLKALTWPMERKQLFTWIWCLAITMRDLHATNIYHRDIKPDNILIYGNKVLLTDFGISFCTDGNTKRLLTTTQGSDKYEPPESRVLGDETRRHKCGPEGDVFSLGCVFYEMLLLTISPELRTRYRIQEVNDETYESILQLALENGETEPFPEVKIDKSLESRGLEMELVPADDRFIGQAETYFNAVVSYMMVFRDQRMDMDEITRMIAPSVAVDLQNFCCFWIRIADIPKEATIAPRRRT